MMTKLATRLRRFLRNNRGNAAIEFAAVVPLLAVGAGSISDAANIGMGASDMQGAVRASIQYVMNGGSDMSVAASQGTSAWANKPASGTINVTKAWYCGDAAGTQGVLCGDGNVPTAYVTAVATANLGGDIFHISKTVTEKVRVQ